MAEKNQTHVAAPVAEHVGSARRPGLADLLLLPFRMLYKLWFGLVFFGTLALLYPAFRWLLRTPASYPKAFRLMRVWARCLSWLVGTPLLVQRRAPLPPPPYVICFNHGSYLDIIQAYNLLPDYFLFMGKHELLRWPLFNIFFKGMNIAVDRKSKIGAARALVAASRALRAGECVALFPEGTIPASAPRMKKFKDGAFKLAIEHQVPIVPVTFRNNWRLFGEPLLLWVPAGPGIAKAVQHPHIDTTGMDMNDIDTLRHRVFAEIDSALPKT